MTHCVRNITGLALLIGPLCMASCTLNREGEGLEVWGTDAAIPDAALDGGFDSISPADVTTDSPWSEDAPVETDAEQEAGGDAADVEPCVGETDAELCDALGHECGTDITTDRCGVERNLICGDCSLPDTCGGTGIPNQCGAWWDCQWITRQQLRIQAQDDLPAGYSISLELDHKTLVDTDLSILSGDDIRILRKGSSDWIEIDRVVDPDSGWNRSDTKIWFALEDPIAAGAIDDEYYLYYSATVEDPPADENAVFHFADFFERANSNDVGNGWSVDQSNSTSINILNNTMHFATAGDRNNRPVADYAFDPLDAIVEWRMGFHWRRSGSESTYRLHLQLGSGQAMGHPPDSNTWHVAGTGPSLVWAGTNQGMTNHEGLGPEVGGSASQLAVVSGAASLRIVASIPLQTYDLFVDGTAVGSDLAFSSNQTSLDKVRLFTWQLYQSNFADRNFGYVIVRPLVDNPPLVEIDGAFTYICT